MKNLITVIILMLSMETFAYDVRIRDSQTGQAVAAQITVTRINDKDISKQQWSQLKLGMDIENIKNKAQSISVNSNRYLYKMSSQSELQIINVTAENYQANQTYIEANQDIQLTDIFIDRTDKQASLCKGDNICGYIYDAGSIEPLKNVNIELSNTQHSYITHTNQRGFFKFRQKIPSNATLVIGHSGYRTQIFNAINLKSSFSMIIDLERGSGITEHSMRHPLADVRDNQVDAHWLQSKLTQKATESDDGIKERPGGGYYLQPPAQIRVGFDASGGSCCGSNCATSQVYSLESYVQKGLDNEWIASWNSESLKAGSIPYRSYGAWHVLNTPYSGYDICAGPCCQAFGSTSYTATVSAAQATSGIMLETNGVLARSEYSAQNNAWDDPNDGLSCSNADLSCGDGSVGSPATGWPCLSDPASTGHGCFGHGRGMSQWGTQFNALVGDDFAHIVDFYYNANNNPSGQRSQYNSSPIKIDGIVASTASVHANQVFTIDFNVFNANPASENFGPIMLGASLINPNAVYSDPVNDAVYTLTQSGSNQLMRSFQIPADPQMGVYDLVTAVYLDVNGDNNITAADWALVSFTLSNQMTIVALPDLMFSDSFE